MAFTTALPLLLALVFFLVGVGGILFHRNLLYSMLSINYLLLSAVLILACSGVDSYGLLLLGAGLTVVFLLLSLFTLFYRYHHNLDVKAVTEEQEQP